MAVRNEFSEAMMNIVEEFRNLHAKAVKTKATPFGQEKVSARELRGRLETMTSAQRKAMLENPETRAQILAAIKESA